MARSGSTWRRRDGWKRLRTGTLVLEALALYDLAAPTPTSKKQPGFACAAVYTYPFFLLVVDKAGRAYRPRIPVDACGQPQQPVLDALAAITWTSNGSFPVVWR